VNNCIIIHITVRLSIDPYLRVYSEVSLRGVLKCFREEDSAEEHDAPLSASLNTLPSRGLWGRC
jgi:hypothetical protein